MVAVAKNVISGSPSRVKGLDAGREGEEFNFVVQAAERPVRFRVIREEHHGERGWAVRIDGIPGPSIVHERPWASVDAAHAAAVKAINTILALERRQREELERQRA